MEDTMSEEKQEEQKPEQPKEKSQYAIFITRNKDGSLSYGPMKNTEQFEREPAPWESRALAQEMLDGMAHQNIVFGVMRAFQSMINQTSPIINPVENPGLNRREKRWFNKH
jgi:hypothetical protein